MKILLDENVDNRLVSVLDSQGHGVKTTNGEGLGSAPDSEVMDYAYRNDLAVLTHDDDFLRLVDGMDSHPTLIFLPQRIRFRRMKERIKKLDEDTSIRGEVIFA